jgi:TRAP-type C4-dicarboxylate transport system substrate-binding protein
MAMTTIGPVPIRVLIVSATAALVLGACAPPADKAGTAADAAQTTVITLATIDDIDPNGQSAGTRAFVAALGRRSAGKLKVEMRTKFGDGAATAETDLVKAIVDGDVDGGWPSTRAFAGAGFPGLKAVEAPLTLTNAAAVQALATGPAGKKLMSTLDGSDIVPLGLTFGALRRPWSARAPLTDPASWRSTTFRVYNSPVQTQAVEALGAKPVNASFEFTGLVHRGRLDGVELDISQYAHNGYGLLLPYVTRNVVLWPKVFVLSMNRLHFESLSSQQQEWIRAAARDAVAASGEADHDESVAAKALCAAGVKFVDAGAKDLSALGARMKPVSDQLARDPETGALFAEIRRIAAAHPDADVPKVAANCMVSP